MQKRKDKTPEDILQRLLDHKNASKWRSADETVQKKQENVKNDLELRVVQSRDDVTRPTSHREEEVVSICPQQDKCSPAWLSGFITGGELQESLSIQPKTSTLAVHPVKMAQQQLEHPPAIDIKDMRHLSDDEERREL